MLKLSPSRFLRDFDPRLKIVSGLVLGLAVWRADHVELVIFTAFFLWLALLPGLRPAMLHGPRVAALFAGTWSAVLAAMRLLEGVEPFAALEEAGLLGLRLMALMFLGLVLGGSSSPRSLGLGWAWLLRPVLRGRAWTVALALALMLDSLPATLRALRQVRATVRQRAGGLPSRQRWALLAEASVRALGQTAWRRTVALAARGLDNPAAWRTRIPWRLPDLAVFAAVLSAAAAVSW